MSVQQIIKNSKMAKLKRDPAFNDVKSIVDLILADKIESIISFADSKIEEARQEVLALKSGMAKGDKGDSVDENKIIQTVLGYLPVPKDGHTPTKDELVRLIKPLIPKVRDGKDANEAMIVRQVLGKIKKPKDGSPDTPQQIATKLNTLEEKVDMKVIKGLKKLIDRVYKAVQETKRMSNGGGGMGNITHQTFQVTSATTSVGLTYNVAAGGNAIWAYYQGQFLVKGTAYNISGKTLTLLFTPQDDTYIDITYVRN